MKNEAKLEPIRGKAAFRKNKPCPCGSGKKYKKCCRWMERASFIATRAMLSSKGKEGRFIYRPLKERP